MKSIAERFKYLRHLTRLSQSEFAHMIQLSQGRLSDIERGKNKPSVDTLLAVVEFFNISASWLLQGTGKPPTNLHTPPHESSAGEVDSISLSASEYSLLREYRKLEETEKKQLWVFLDFLSYTQKHNKGLASSGFSEMDN